MEDIERFKTENGCSRVVAVWCGSTEVYREPTEVHATLKSFEEGLATKAIPKSALRKSTPTPAIKLGVPYCNGAPNLTRRHRRHPGIGSRDSHANRRQGLQDRPDPDEDDPGARLQGAHARHERLVLHQHPGQPGRRGARRSRDLQDQGDLEARRAGAHPPARAVPGALRRHLPQGTDQLLPAPRRQQRGLGQHRHLRVAGLPDADQDRLPVPRLDPRRADRPRPGAVHGPRPAGRHARHPGVAVLLLQEPA